MKALFKLVKRQKDPPSLTVTDTLSPNPEQATSTSTSSADSMSFATTIQPAGFTVSLQLSPSRQYWLNHWSSFDQTAHELQDSTSVSALAMNDLARLENNCNQPPRSFDTTTQTKLESTQSEQNLSVSCSHHMLSAFADADSVFYPGYLREFPEFTRFWRHFCKYLSELL